MNNKERTMLNWDNYKKQKHFGLNLHVIYLEKQKRIL